MKRLSLILCLCIAIISGCSYGSDSTTSSGKNNQNSKNTTKPTTYPTATPFSDPEKARVSFTKETFPRIDGSTVTIPLSEGIASELLKIDTGKVKNFITHYTTHPSYENLIDGKADIIFVTEPSDEELDLAKSKKIELEIVPVVKDAFVFLVNSKNKVDSLTVEQIQEIYQGKISNWKSVGGSNTPIIAYQRPKNSGSQTLMENIVMKGLTMSEAPKEHIPAGMGNLIESISGYNNSENALGYSVYYYAKNMYIRDRIKYLKINYVEPLNETISNNTYPFSISYYAVLKKNEPENSSARRLLNWLLSDDGQKIAVKSGYVPMR